MFNDLLIFLKRINNSIPTENSKPASPIMKKLVETKVKSSLIPPHNTVYTYNVIQVISLYNSILKKFSILITNPNILNQKKKFQKFNHVCIIFIYNSINSFCTYANLFSKKL